MPKREPTYGEIIKTRVKCLLTRLLEYANDEIEERYKIDVSWENDRKIIIKTNLIALAALTDLKKEEVREALNSYLKEFLGILEYLPGTRKQGLALQYFVLTLWYPKHQKDKNLQQFEEEWTNRRNAKPGVQRSQKSQPKPTRIDNLPESGVIEFVGREKELQQLHQLLQQNQRVAIAAIAGMGGIGKTELALQYALQHRQTYPGGICWLLGKAGDVGVKILELARNLHNINPPDDFDLEQKIQFCWRRWREGNVLLVLDDISDYREVKAYLQFPSSRFKALITTREKLQPPVVRLDLDVLKPLAAMRLLKKLVGKERIKREPWTARKLCKWLGYLPLGLELVGRYLAIDEDLTLAQMLEALEQERLQNPALADAPGEMTAERGVAAAFELSWRKLSENAQILGCLLSLFALAPIPWELVEAVEIAKGKIWQKGRHELIKLHLVQRKSEGIYQLHPLLKRFFQDKLTEINQGEELKRAFCLVMVGVAKEIPDVLTLKQVADISPKQPHIAEVAENLIEYVSDENSPGLFFVNAIFYKSQGLYTPALLWCEQCLGITKKRLGEEHPYFATSLNNLAFLYKSQGKYNEAELLFLQALQLYRRLLGEEHPHFAQNLNNLAEIYCFQGKYSEAEPLFLQALELRRHLLTEEHPDFAQSLNNLAGFHYYQGRYSEAEPLFLQALELYRRLSGEEHPDFANSLNNLAGFHYYQGRYSEAEPLLLQALELKRGLLGEKHPDFATSLNNLAEFYCSQGRYSEAEPLFLQALELYRRLLGEEHPDFANSLNNLANLYYAQGRYSEAEPLYLQALELYQHFLGEKHPLVATSRNNLAHLYSFQNRYSEAEPLFMQALEITRCLLGEEHPDFATSLNNLAGLYKSLGRYSEAEPLYEQAVEICEKKLGVNHPNTATVRENWAKLRAQLSSES
jgi:tetratricopeptide (TPR) repeat protein